MPYDPIPEVTAEYDPFANLGDIMEEFGPASQGYRPPVNQQAYVNQAPTPTVAPTPLDQEQQLEQDLLLAQEGNAEAQARVENYFQTRPEQIREHGNLAIQARDAMINSLLKTVPVVAEHVRRHCEQLSASLTSRNQSPLAQLAIDRIILASLAAAIMDSLQAGNISKPELYQKTAKALEVAERRLQTAVKTLDLVEELERRRVRNFDPLLATAPGRGLNT